jgi:hypothetical protein
MGAEHGDRFTGLQLEGVSGPYWETEVENLQKFLADELESTARNKITGEGRNLDLG